ncbi:hypothetical protein SAMN04487988_101545 [Algoriphagus hitonicola]|uniref:Uncharacterized protein n=1 Tax=Algoriphagus hitonicola TaxID=435880 RepID=A0A1I2PK19_9BACT|nr:hypothetical protein [Algoriphagus hitonicola]SFG13986.1 hypothetical protein SAMN04487988_101545 [Algoriphagus hitonicola]
MECRTGSVQLLIKKLHLLTKSDSLFGQLIELRDQLPDLFAATLHLRAGMEEYAGGVGYFRSPPTEGEVAQFRQK